MIPVLITSILTVCYFLSIALVYKAIVSGRSDLTIFYLIFSYHYDIINYVFRLNILVLRRCA